MATSRTQVKFGEIGETETEKAYTYLKNNFNNWYHFNQ